MLLRWLSSKSVTLAHRRKRLISAVRSFLVDFCSVLANAHLNFSGIAPAPSNHFRNELANIYHTPYPFLPSQVGPNGVVTRPFSASFLPALYPHLGSTDLATPAIPSVLPDLHYMRYNGQDHRVPVYYPPRRDSPASWTSRSVTLSSLPSPRRRHSTPSNIWFGSSFGDGVYPSFPPASPVRESHTFNENYQRLVENSTTL